MNYLLIAISFIALIHVSVMLINAYSKSIKIYREGAQGMRNYDKLDDGLAEQFEALDEDNKSLANTILRYGSIIIFGLFRVPIFVLLAYLLIQFIKLQW